MFYCVDNKTGKRTSLHTSDADEGRQLVEVKNQAVRQSQMNLQITQVYLQHGDPTLASRTWQHAMEQIISTKTGNKCKRWEHAIKDIQATLPTRVLGVES